MGSAFADAARSVPVGCLPTPGSATREKLLVDDGGRRVNPAFCHGKIDEGHAKRVLCHESIGGFPDSNSWTGVGFDSRQSINSSPASLQQLRKGGGPDPLQWRGGGGTATPCRRFEEGAVIDARES